MKNFTFLIRSLILSAVTLFAVVFFNGCDENGINDPVIGSDSNVVEYHNIQPVFWRYGLNDTTYMGVNIYNGTLTLSTSSEKDMLFIDNMNEYRNFYFRSGSMSDIPGDYIPGKETRFYFINAYNNISQSQWDTMSVIPDTDEFLEPEDFTTSSTADFNYMNPGQMNKPVYFFYLKGKYEDGITNGKRVYGMLWVKDVISYSNPEGVSPVIDIKMNLAGENKFNK